MPRVLMPLAEGFEEIEAIAVVDILRRAGIEVVLAATLPGHVCGGHSISLLPDATLDTVRAEDFDMIVLPGGQPGTTNLGADARIRRLLNDFGKAGKLIGAICAAPTVLAEAGLLDGKKATAYPSYREKMAAAIFQDSAVVTDGNIITAQGAGAAIAFGLTITTRLAGNHTAENIKKAMLVVDHQKQEAIWNDRLFDSTIQALVGALEMKDSYTQGHAKRVTEYSLSVGKKLNLPEGEMRDLYLGAVLHDIGKIGTEENVLNKPESLNLREETLIREHPLKGTLFIVGIENLSHIVPTILHHHERWDGSGYPGRLKGEQIPLHARIVAIADAFDAMLSTRSYRAGLSKESATIELQKGKGTQFDPFVVDVFIECLNESPFEMKDFSYYF